MSDPHTFHGPKNFRELFAEAEAAAKRRLAEGKPLRLSPEARTDNNEATVWLYDAIDTWFGLDPAVFAREIAAIDAGVIHLRINSPGGMVTGAEVIQTTLQQHPAKVIAHVDGWAASAATIVALGADEIEMSDGAWWMIHNTWGVAVGGVEDMLAYAEILEKMNVNLAADYMRKTGASEAQVRAWMDAETWFTAQEALDSGFVDRVFTVGNAEPGGRAMSAVNEWYARYGKEEGFACGVPAANGWTVKGEEGSRAAREEVKRLARLRALTLAELEI